MSTFTEFTFLSSDGKTDIRVRKWAPDGEPRGVVQIAHGVAEYSERYETFMRFLADNGFVAAANDHLGHGKSVASESDLGFFAERNGWNLVVEDMHTLHELLTGEYPGLPFILFGHSMGSFLARTYLIRFPEELTGAIICGTGQQSPALVGAGRAAAGLICALQGPRTRSALLNNMAFGSYNKEFMPIRTECDWISRSEQSVDAYVADPLCGFTATAGLFRDMMGGIAFIGAKKNIARMRRDLPVLFIAGERDPVGEQGAGVRRAFDAFREVGMQDVEIKLYPECRHEILNELNRDEVMNDVLAWICRKI